jgi:hypothetical protein
MVGGGGLQGALGGRGRHACVGQTRAAWSRRLFTRARRSQEPIARHSAFQGPIHTYMRARIDSRSGSSASVYHCGRTALGSRAAPGMVEGRGAMGASAATRNMLSMRLWLVCGSRARRPVKRRCAVIGCGLKTVPYRFTWVSCANPHCTASLSHKHLHYSLAPRMAPGAGRCAWRSVGPRKSVQRARAALLSRVASLSAVFGMSLPPLHPRRGFQPRLPFAVPQCGYRPQHAVSGVGRPGRQRFACFARLLSLRRRLRRLSSRCTARCALA